MKIKTLMIAAALLSASYSQAAPRTAKPAPAAKAAKPAETARQEAAQQEGGIHFSDGIAAVADNEVITRRRLAQAVADAKANLPKGVQISDTALTEQVLMQLVNQSLIVQAGKRRNIQATEAEIDAVVAQNPALKNLSPAQHILIKADSENAAVGAESTIRKIYGEARSGTDFSSLARQYSQDASAGNGGDLGWFADGVMVPAFEEAVRSLKPGQVSAPVRTQFGWHIIKLNEVREAGTPQERVRNAVRQYIFQQKAERATADLLRDLHSGAYIDIR